MISIFTESKISSPSLTSIEVDLLVTTPPTRMTVISGFSFNSKAVAIQLSQLLSGLEYH